MANKDFYRSITLLVSIISLAIIMLIGSFSALFLDKSYYESLYEKTGAYERLGKDAVNNKTAELFLFFENKGSLDEKFYTANEISHLNDVRRLVRNAFVAYYFSLFLFLGSIIVWYMLYRKEFYSLISKAMLFSGTGILIGAILFFLFNFTGLFENFHRLFFSENYAFPASSNMLKMFNEDFFRIFATKIFILSVIKGAAAAVVGGILMLKSKRDPTFRR